MKIVFDYNRTIFDPENDCLYPEAINALKRLAEKHELFLISRNEPGRKARLEELGIQEFFQKIVFVDKKTEEDFKDMADGAKEMLVVGDMIKEEILLGNRAGFSTVWIKRGKFAFETPERADEQPTYIINNLEELLDIVL